MWGGQRGSHKGRGEKVWRSGGWKQEKFDKVKKRVKRSYDITVCAEEREKKEKG